MKKVLSFLFVLVLMLSLVPQTEAANVDFKDVPKNHPNYADIMFLLEKGVISGGTKFGVNEKVSREEVAVMVAKAIGLDGKKTKTKFKDVPESRYSSGYINEAVKAGIINGYPDGTFKPNAKVTRGHMAAFIANAFKLTNQADINFKDVKKGSTSYEAVRKLAFANITSGYPDGTFKPNEGLTRAHISAFLARAMQKSPQEVKGNSPGLIVDPPQEVKDPFPELNIENVRSGFGKVYMKAIVNFNPETQKNEMESFAGKVDEGFYLYMYGKYSNVGNYFVQLDILNNLTPEYENELKEALKQMEVHKYNQKLYVNLANIYQFYRSKDMEVDYRNYDGDGYMTIDIIKKPVVKSNY